MPNKTYRDSKGRFKKKPWWKRFFSALWRNTKPCAGYDRDFKETMKFGVKTKLRF